ncbi:S-adenosyl-L-methionine dependent methyltransferase [Penicillium coprophilum]|uniref:S-adenosyl-L-methionine dependent methyltransferase n=1 Tax=Penicillium coprophilum TaxID=36646 RepID=UPI0023A53CA9|nr:S-adenosyl-L-methionine dependent methyltransferase [Penicillium coprophilum]KAJ5173529.1 S-adenosyl-L-methionine dependent methyltransferase [Penicillium coprophilum]
MTADGVIHGVYVLGRGVRKDSWFAAFIRRGGLNHGVFHNKEDNAFEFERALRENFLQVETWVVGSIFIFRAARPINN